MKRLIFLLVISLPFLTIAQGEGNNWFFGFGAGLHFNQDGTVEVLSDGEIISHEGSASISSPSGELLFYTDGRTIFNRNHLIMTNGDNLFGNPTSTQSALIIPLPQNPNLYYVFTVDATTSGVRGRGLNYSIVDMTADNGNGAVINKNINLLEDCAEKLTAVTSDCRGETLWVVTVATETGASMPSGPPFPNFNTYHAFEMNSTGVLTTSVKSTFTVNNPDDRGYLKFSPDGTKLASANSGFNGSNGTDNLFLSDFDVATGVVSNQQRININNTPNIFPYGVEFSPNSQYLYVHSSNGRFALDGHESSLIQYDILSDSQIIIEDRSLFRGALQLGPDGKIYRTLSTNYENGSSVDTFRTDGDSYLGVINNPNANGAACDYQHNAIQIDGNRIRQGLPPFVQSFFTEVSLTQIDDIVIDGALAACLDEPLVLETQNIPGATYTWEKDNVPFANPGNIYEIPNASLSDQGIYTVTVIRPNAIECPIIGEINVTVFDKPEINQLTLTVCDSGDDNALDGFTTIDLRRMDSDQDLVYTYYETIADLESDLPIVTPTTYENTTPYGQLIYYKVANVSGCESFNELNLIVRDVPDFVLEETYLLCTDGASPSIEGPDGFDAYSWIRIEEGQRSISSTEKDFLVTEGGTYILEATIQVTNNGFDDSCISSANFEVIASNSAFIVEVIAERFTDNDTSVEVVVTGDGDYEFSSDDATYQDSNILENVNAGNVTVYVRDKNGCGIVSESIELLPDTSSGFPNFFTPNNDGVNDLWQVLPTPLGEEMDIVDIQIFNRFGHLMAQIDPNSLGWDGNLNGRAQPSSDYWFRATKITGEFIKGHFTLKR